MVKGAPYKGGGNSGGGGAGGGAGGARVVDHNMQAMFLHVLADTLGSVGVIISTYFVEYHQMTWTDPVSASLCRADRALWVNAVEDHGAEESLFVGQERVVSSVLTAVSRASGSPFSASRTAR